jgi:DNA repair protein RadC
MQVYEITPQYHLVRLGNEEPLDRPEQIVRYMDGAFAAEPTVESVWVIALNTKFRPLGRVKISSGTLNSCLVHPREVFRAAIMASACSIVLVHNHPSGDPAPSPADVAVTRKIREAGEIMQIELVDHVIIGCPTDDPLGLGFYSFRSGGLLG